MVRVRLTSAEDWPLHNTATGHHDTTRWNEARGMGIVIGDPVKPNREDWNCNTDLVWPVLQWKPPAYIEDGQTPYVCRHMIDAGD